MRAPRLRAERDGDALRVWCEHCGTWHYHGGAVAGHRLAHCRGRTPYKLTGYYLVPSRKPAAPRRPVAPHPRRRA